MSALESQIDDLYKGPLDRFTASRNALAKTLSKTEAARVKKLAKPTAVPWAINQLYWKARPTWDRLLKSGEKLRAAQLGALKGARADVRAASDAHRQAVSDAAHAAERAASQSGSAPPADALMRALEALSLMSHAPSPPGRLTTAPQPAGFEALTGVPIRAGDVRPFPAAVQSVRDVPDRGDAKRASVIGREAERERKAAAARAKKEAAAAAKRAAEVKKAEAKLARARAGAEAAEAALEKLRRSR
jgi:hypothetical protein